MARCAAEPCERWRPRVLTAMTGVRIDDGWFCSRDCVERMVRRRLTAAPPVGPQPVPAPPQVRLGVLLRTHGVLSADQLHQVLEQQRRSGLRLGAQVRASYGVDGAHILRALAVQAGARYLTSIDPSTVHDAPGGLSREAVAALGLIPLSRPDSRNAVRVAVMAPGRPDALQALRKLVDWIPEPFLVEDEMWHTLLEHYGSGLPHRGRNATRPTGVVVRSAHEAATWVALFAAGTRRAHIAEAYWEPYTCVRVQADRTVQDVLFSRAVEREMTWQEANTSH